MSEATPLSHLDMSELKALKKDAQNRKNVLNRAIRQQDCDMVPEQNILLRDLTEEIWRIDLAIANEADFEDSL